MTIHLIACGETGSKWDGQGPSIGVNDCFKWGHHPDYLVLLNNPSQFQSSRLEVIKETKPRKVLTNAPSAWEPYFQHVQQIPLRRWSSSEKLDKGHIFHSMTSPFVGISLAHNWGFTKIILWGVDFTNHHKYGKHCSAHVGEMLKYVSFFKSLESVGTKVLLGSPGTALDHHLQVWNKEKEIV